MEYNNKEQQYMYKNKGETWAVRTGQDLAKETIELKRKGKGKTRKGKEEELKTEKRDDYSSRRKEKQKESWQKS